MTEKEQPSGADEGSGDQGGTDSGGGSADEPTWTPPDLGESEIREGEGDRTSVWEPPVRKEDR